MGGAGISARGGAGGGGAAAEVDEVKGLKGMKKGCDGDTERRGVAEGVSGLAEKMVTRGGVGRGRWGEE